MQEEEEVSAAALAALSAALADLVVQVVVVVQGTPPATQAGQLRNQACLNLQIVLTMAVLGAAALAQEVQNQMAVPEVEPAVPGQQGFLYRLQGLL
jgi:hypothetical protein